VSKVALQVSTVTGIGRAAVHAYQTDAMPRLPAWFHSAGSLVASIVVPASVTGSASPSCAASTKSSSG
jgi:hypothetical protein